MSHSINALLAWKLRLGVLLMALALAAPSAQAEDVPGEFDYYVVALSWSPTYCEQEGDQRDSPQCERDYGFVLHGLWPQHERGYPERCGDPGWVDNDVIRDNLDIIPARGAVLHQWRKHGVCTGLDAEDYFDLSRVAYEKIVIPPPLRKLERWIVIDPQVVEDAFMAANPGMEDDMISTVCRGDRFREVRVCMTRDLELRACGRDADRDCRDDSVRMPPVR